MTMRLHEAEQIILQAIEKIRKGGFELIDSQTADDAQYEDCEEIILNKRGDKIYMRKDS